MKKLEIKKDNQEALYSNLPNYKIMKIVIN